MTNDLANNNGRIIEKYEVEKNFIRIYYLDGTTQIIELSLYNIDRVNEQMIEQAMEIIKEHSSEQFIYERRIKEVRIFLSSIVGLIVSSAVFELGIDGFDEHRIFAEILASIFIPTMIFVFRNRELQKNDLDIKKYEMYISHMDEFKENGFKDFVYDGIHKKGYVGINNLDKYNYWEVERMVQNLEKVRRRTQN